MCVCGGGRWVGGCEGGEGSVWVGQPSLML